MHTFSTAAEDDTSANRRCEDRQAGHGRTLADVENGARLAAGLECGTTSVSSHGEVAPHITFGGMKSSGVRRTGGTHGLDGYINCKPNTYT